LAAIASLLLSS